MSPAGRDSSLHFSPWKPSLLALPPPLTTVPQQPDPPSLGSLKQLPECHEASGPAPRRREPPFSRSPAQAKGPSQGLRAS